VAAEGGRVGVAQFSINGFENAFEIVVDVVVPEAQNSEAILGKTCVACFIAFRMT
jgi:hypothetical protein